MDLSSLDDLLCPMLYIRESVTFIRVYWGVDSGGRGGGGIPSSLYRIYERASHCICRVKLFNCVDFRLCLYMYTPILLQLSLSVFASELITLR